MPVLSSANINLHYEVHGAGEPFVLSHDLTASARDWHRHLPWLTRRHRMILPDARGHGMSSAPAGDDHYSWEIMADDINRLLVHLGIERAVVGGVSMGGGVSLAFALAHPEKVSCLILCDCAGTGVGRQEVLSPAEMEQQLVTRRTMIRRYGVMDVVGYRLISDGLAPRTVMTDPAAREEWLERLSRFSENGAIHAPTFVRGTVVSGLERVAGLEMPALVVIGEEDALLPAAEWLRDTLPNRRYALLRGVGHITARYRPDAWRQVVEAFLQDVAAGRDIRSEVTL